MIYLFESEISETKPIIFALTEIYGIGKTNSVLICKNLGFCKNLNVKRLSKEQVNKLVKTINFLNI